MPNNELDTFEDIYMAGIGRVKGDETDASTLARFKESIQTWYQTICSRKKWKFLRVTDRSLKLKNKYTTGTISIANGSRMVTGVGTSWTDDHRNWWFQPSGSDNSYRVISITSATTCILSSTLVEDTITDGTYKLYQGEIALFPDCDDIDDLRIDGKRKIEPRGPAFIAAMRRQHPTREGYPLFYSIEGEAYFSGPILSEFVLGYDFLGKGMTTAMSFFPHIPDDDYTLQIQYKRKIKPLVNANDRPLIPKDHRNILLFFALSDWYFKDRQDTTGRHYLGLAKDELKEMSTKYLDTDDVLTFNLADFSSASHSYLMRTSQNYFDTEG